jgi:sugar phosphate isomerase/epimerase
MIGGTGCFAIVSQTVPRKEFPESAIDTLEKAKALGLDGVPIGMESLEEEKLRKVRNKAEELGMYLETSVHIPRTFSDYRTFEKQIEAAVVFGARAAGAGGLMPPIPWHNEPFPTHEEARKLIENAKKGLVEAERIARRHKMRVVFENHMDLTGDEYFEIMKAVGSEYLGICLDTGNPLWTLEDPLETTKKLAPYTHMTHLKHYRITRTEETFMLDNVPLGQGHVTQLPEIVKILKKEGNLDNCFTFEMLTGNQANFRWLEDGFWKRYPEIRCEDLVRTLRLIFETPRTGWLPVPRLTGGAQHGQYPSIVAWEERNVRMCIDYARKVLKL